MAAAPPKAPRHAAGGPAGIGSGTLRRIAVALVRPSPYQPRQEFDMAELTGLAASLTESGLLQPITVRRKPEGTRGRYTEYELIAGERRLRAAQLNRWTYIEAVVKVMTDAEAQTAALVENLQRKDLAPLEEAHAFKRLLADTGWSQAELARRTGIPRATIGDRLRMLDLPEVWRTLFASGALQTSHGAVLHLFRELPPAVHAAALKEVRASYEWRSAQESGGPIAVSTFAEVVRRTYQYSLHPLEGTGWNGCEFDPQAYDGAVITYQRPHHDTKPRRYAADPDKWRPLVAAAKKQRVEREIRPVVATGDRRLVLPKGTEIVKVNYATDRVKGAEVLTTADGAWDVPGGEHAFDVEQFLAMHDAAKLLRVASQYQSGLDRTATRDRRAVAYARDVWRQRWAARETELAGAYVDALRQQQAAYSVRGPGAKLLLRAVASNERNAAEHAQRLVHLGRALGLAVPDLPATEHWKWASPVLAWVDGLGTDIGVHPGWEIAISEVEMLATAYATAAGAGLEPPALQVLQEQRAELRRYKTIPVPWIEGSGRADAAPAPRAERVASPPGRPLAQLVTAEREVVRRGAAAAALPDSAAPAAPLAREALTAERLDGRA